MNKKKPYQKLDNVEIGLITTQLLYSLKENKLDPVLGLYPIDLDPDERDYLVHLLETERHKARRRGSTDPQ